jgi:hypothetical protein
VPDDLLARYNYAEFTKTTVLPWLRFDRSPPLGQRAPDFPLWHLGGPETRLREVWSASEYTIVEFGSFT